MQSMGYLYKTRLMTALLVASSVSACSVFQTYTEPAIKTPATWQAALPHDGNLNHLVNWWAQFNDPVLLKLLNAAEHDNPSLDIAVANIKAARANIAVTNAGRLPSLNANASDTRAKNNTFANNAIATGITESTKASLDASWELDLFGAVKFSTQAAKARLDATENDWHEARVSLAAEVSNQYLDFRTCQLLIEIYQQQQRSTQETARLTSIKVNAGFAAPADNALAQAAANSVQSQLIAQQAQCDNAIKSLVALTGLEEPTLRQTLASVTSKMPIPAQFIVSSVPAQLVKQRPDLASNERALAAASADIGTAQANRYPKLTLTGSIGLVDTTIGSFNTSGKTWSIGPSLSLPIFNAGKLKAQVTSAEAKYEIALATYQQNTRYAIKEVEQSLVNLDSAAKRVQTEKISTDQYLAYLKATEINWRAGGASLLNLEDARRQAISAELTLVNQQHDRVKYWIALYKALGGGWTQSEKQTNTGDKE